MKDITRRDLVFSCFSCFLILLMPRWPLEWFHLNVPTKTMLMIYISLSKKLQSEVTHGQAKGSEGNLASSFFPCSYSYKMLDVLVNIACHSSCVNCWDPDAILQASQLSNTYLPCAFCSIISSIHQEDNNIQKNKFKTQMGQSCIVGIKSTDSCKLQRHGVTYLPIFSRHWI